MSGWMSGLEMKSFTSVWKNAQILFFRILWVKQKVGFIIQHKIVLRSVWWDGAKDFGKVGKKKLKTVTNIRIKFF